MKNIKRIAYRTSLLVTLVVILTMASTRTQAQFQPEDSGTCSGVSVSVPFTDVAGSIFFCTIAEAYFSGLTNGTDATHYSPSANVTRDQMSAFVTRTQDSALRRGSHRAALGQWATPSSLSASAATLIGNGTRYVQSDGADVWVSNPDSNSVARVRASDGKLLDTYIGITDSAGVLVARGRIYVASGTTPGVLYSIDPKLTSATAGAVTTVASTLGSGPDGITTDGTYIWTANNDGTVSKINPDTGAVQTFTHSTGNLHGILYDGATVWVTDSTFSKLLMLNSTGNLVLQTITVGSGPRLPIFDGTNIWVPNFDANSLTVVRVKDGAGNPLPPPPAANAPFVVATLTGNGLSGPRVAAFDGQRILVTSFLTAHVSLWKAADFSPLSISSPRPNAILNGACSDGINFWIADVNGYLVRF